MERDKATVVMRMGACCALLMLLGACGWAAGRQQPVQIPSVPVAIQTVDRAVLSADSLEKTRLELEQERRKSLDLLNRVIDDPGAGDEARNAAMQEMTRIASGIEREAALCAVLSQMGFADALAVLGEEAVTVIAPWQLAENEQNRVRIIDAAVSQTGFSADSVKIILAKNE